MLNLDNIISNKNENKNNNWPFRILIIGPSVSGKTNMLLHLINDLHTINKIYLYAKDLHEPKYEYLINKREQAGIKNLNDPKAFIEYSDDMDDILIDIIGKAFITRLDKTAEGYQEEGVLKLLKYIRDDLANGANRLNNRPNRFNNRPDDRPDDRLDDRPDDRSDDRPDDDDDSFDTTPYDTTPYDTPYMSDGKDDIKNNKKNIIIYCLNIFN